MIFWIVSHKKITEIISKSRKFVHWWTKNNNHFEITPIFGICTNRPWPTSDHSTFEWSDLRTIWVHGCRQDLLESGQKNTRNLQKLIFTSNSNLFPSDNRFRSRISVFRSISVVDKSIQYVSGIFLSRLWTYQNHLEAAEYQKNAWLQSWMFRDVVTAIGSISRTQGSRDISSLGTL